MKRRCLEPLHLGGLDIPAGASVDVIVDAASRDPAVFPDPPRCIINRGSRLPILLEVSTANFLRRAGDMLWPGGLLLDMGSSCSKP